MWRWLPCHNVAMNSAFNVIQTDWKCLLGPYKSQISSCNPGKFISVQSHLIIQWHIYFQSKRDCLINMFKICLICDFLIRHYYNYQTNIYKETDSGIFNQGKAGKWAEHWWHKHTALMKRVRRICVTVRKDCSQVDHVN